MNAFAKGSLQRIWSILWTNFLLGLIAVLPFAVTVAILVWVARFAQGILGPNTFFGGRLQALGMQFAANETLAYLVGCVFAVLAIFVLGVLMKYGARRVLQERIAPLIRRIPIVGNLYSTTAQLAGMLEKSDKADMKRMQVVYAAFGQEHGSGILGLMPSPECYHINGRDYHIVYIPTSPVPMTGGLIFVPKESVTPVHMKVESLMSIYLSMGVTGGEFLQSSQIRDG